MPINIEEEVVPAKTRTGARRLNFILSEQAYLELQALARKSRRSMTELVRYGIGIMKIAIEAHGNGHRLMIVDQDSRAIREIVIPG